MPPTSANGTLLIISNASPTRRNARYNSTLMIIFVGLLSALLDISHPDAPDDHDLALVSHTLRDAIADARQDPSLKCRLGAENRRSSQRVRDLMRASW